MAIRNYHTPDDHDPLAGFYAPTPAKPAWRTVSQSVAFNRGNAGNVDTARYKKQSQYDRPLEQHPYNPNAAKGVGSKSGNVPVYDQNQWEFQRKKIQLQAKLDSARDQFGRKMRGRIRWTGSDYVLEFVDPAWMTGDTADFDLADWLAGGTGHPVHIPKVLQSLPSQTGAATVLPATNPTGISKAELDTQKILKNLASDITNNQKNTSKKWKWRV